MDRGRGSALALFAIGLAVGAAPGEAIGQETPRVAVIATGGTIAGRSGAGQLTGAELISAVPALADVATLEVEEFSRIGSSAMTPEHWVRLSRRVNELLRADAALAGVVVTHGTDTIEETAYLLHLTVDDPRPVVLVGSMRNASAVSADGPANLLSGVRVAVAPEARGHGALVVLNDEVHSARDVRKADNNRVDTFVSREWGALAVVDADGIFFRRAITTLHTVGSELAGALDGDVDLPLVPIVADFTGNDGSIVRRWVDEGADAVVVQAFGGGRSSPGMRAAVTEAAAAGVPVVLASRVPEGRVMSGVGDPREGRLTAGDLPAHKVRVLMMLALRITADPVELQRLLDTH